MIYAAYALQVLSENPELATRPVLSGIYALIDYFGGRTDGTDPKKFFIEGRELTAEYVSEDDMIENVFATLQHAPRLLDRHRVLFDGHTMTHAHALVLLSRLGYGSVCQLPGESCGRLVTRNAKPEQRCLMRSQLY